MEGGNYIEDGSSRAPTGPGRRGITVVAPEKATTTLEESVLCPSASSRFHEQLQFILATHRNREELVGIEICTPKESINWGFARYRVQERSRTY